MSTPIRMLSAIGQKAFLLLCAATVPACMSFTIHAQQPKIAAFQSLSDLDRCAERFSWDTSVCLPALQDYAKRNPKERFEIAKRARLQFKHWAALQFFEPALGTSPTPAQCADDDLALAVISGLALPESFSELAAAKRIFSGPCFGALRPAVEKEVRAQNGGGYLSTHACVTLMAKSFRLAQCTGNTTEGSNQRNAAASSNESLPPIPVVNLKQASFGLAKVYAGPEGERVAVVKIRGVDDAFAVYFSGIQSHINERTVIHREIDAGTGANYVAILEGGRWVTLTRRNTDRSEWVLYAPGIKNPIRLIYDESASKSFDPQSLRR